MPTKYVRKPTRAYTRYTKDEMTDLDDAIYEAAASEHPISLRGVFYRVVSAGKCAKSEKEYDRIGRELLKLRRSGRLPYGWIVDGTRSTRLVRAYSGLEDALSDTRKFYRRRLWENQDERVMIFTEKDAISGSIWPTTAQWDVPLCVVRGFSSETYLHEIAETINAATGPVHVYQLGDHDPSGVVAWHSIEEKIRGFTESHVVLHMTRLAVTEDQIRGSRTGGTPLLTRPTKLTRNLHAKHASWKSLSIEESVEVDALPPSILRDLVNEAIERHIDPDQLAITKEAEKSEKAILGAIIGDLPEYAE